MAIVKFTKKDDLISNDTHNVEEAYELIEKGFEYGMCINGAEIFCKRK